MTEVDFGEEIPMQQWSQSTRAYVSFIERVAPELVGQRIRVGHQPPHGRIEKFSDRVDLDIAAGKDAREQLRHTVALGHRGGARLAARIEPRAPDAPGRRAFNAEECGGHSTEGGQRQSHVVSLIESNRDIDLKNLRPVEKMVCAKAARK
jgi:hypothetical protein